MINSIKIESFLLLRSQYIELKYGLNVISGESGAGKSMLMDAIKFCLGLRNANEDGTAVELEINNDIIRREIKSGKSRFYINGMASNQKTILEHYVQNILFQEQSSQSKIFKKSFQLEILDKDKDVLKIKKEFVETFDNLKTKEEELKNILFEKEALEKKIEQNQELIEILENLKIDKGTYDDIKRQAKELEYAEKLNLVIQNVLNALEYQDSSALSKINYSISVLNQSISYREDLSKAMDKLHMLKEQLLEIVSFIASYKIYVDNELIDRLNEIIYNVQSLERKYRKSFDELFLIQKAQKQDIENLNTLKDKVRNIFNEIEKLKTNTIEKAAELSNLRKQKAKKLSALINEVLSLLSLKESHFDIDIKRKELSRIGIDDVTFLFSSYSKEHLKELSEVASAGEVSRIVLATSSVLGEYDVYIYDEIDTGTSGEASISIAKLLKKIATKSQIICISHTPALAAASSHHILVKRVSNNVSIKALSEEEKLDELSRLMGIVSDETKIGARKLIESLSDFTNMS